MALIIYGIFIPRVTIAFLYIFSEWFTEVFDTGYWILVGFIFFPTSILWYTVVFNWYGGVWDVWHTFVFAIALIVDIASISKGSSNR